MAVPLPDAIIRVLVLVKPYAYVVLADCHGLAGIGLERIGAAAVDCADDLLLELGFFSGELGFGLEEEVVEIRSGVEGGIHGGGSATAMVGLQGFRGFGVLRLPQKNEEIGS
nr:hypothetical protein GOBAR_DD21952 [Ipomoea batatas]